MSAPAPAGATIDGVDHVAITVRDMDRALGFYRDLLGCEVLGQLLLDDGDRKLVYLRHGHAYLELFADRPATAVAAGASPVPAGGGTPPQGPPPFGFQHVAFHAADVDAVATRLVAAGVRFTLGPLDATGNVRLAFCTDPDGNLVEIVSRLPDMQPYRPGWA
ncbi:MAG TPA: VOC family protein [Trueperaceae bacterium]|nr:VOC family protein [Trueperaceae bacterium]